MITEHPRELSARLKASPFNLSASFVSELVNRKRLPSFPLAIRMRDVAGIPLDFWAPVSSASSHAAPVTSTDKAEASVGHAAGEEGE